jgi:hypothetical protein
MSVTGLFEFAESVPRCLHRVLRTEANATLLEAVPAAVERGHKDTYFLGWEDTFGLFIYDLEHGADRHSGRPREQYTQAPNGLAQ